MSDIRSDDSFADASHELREPLGALRADLEISVTHPERTTWSDVARDTPSDVERLHHLTDDLLLLARLDAHQQRPDRPVDLATVVAEATLGLRRDDLALTAFGLDAAATAGGDRDQLHRMVRNLAHNAEEHADKCIDISVTTDVEAVHVQIADDEPGIAADQRVAVFERFVRLDRARTRVTGGTGLGLAIVGDVVSDHHDTSTIIDS